MCIWWLQRILNDETWLRVVSARYLDEGTIRCRNVGRNENLTELNIVVHHSRKHNIFSFAKVNTICLAVSLTFRLICLRADIWCFFNYFSLFSVVCCRVLNWESKCSYFLLITIFHSIVKIRFISALTSEWTKASCLAKMARKLDTNWDWSVLNTVLINWTTNCCIVEANLPTVVQMPFPNE